MTDNWEDNDDREDDGVGDEDLEEMPAQRRVVRHVVKDLTTAVKMKRVQAQADAEARKAEAQAVLAQIRAEERRRSQELKAEITKIRLGMSAGEKARAHIAVAGPMYLLLLIGGFIVVLATGSVPDEQVSVASALLTLLVTGLMANLRSIVASEGGVSEETNGVHEEDEDEKKDKKKPEASE